MKKSHVVIDKRLPAFQQIADLRRGWKGEMILDVWACHDDLMQVQTELGEWVQGLIKGGADPEKVTQAARALESAVKAASVTRNDLFRLFLHPRESTAKGEHGRQRVALSAEPIDAKELATGHPVASVEHPSEGDSSPIPEADASV